MYDNNSNERKYGNNYPPGGSRIDVSKLDPKRVDDFRERIKREEEEKRNQSSSKGSGRRSYSCTN